MATSSAPLNPQKQQAQLPDVSVGLKIAVSYWRPLPPGSLWKSRSQPRGSQQPTELWRPCTAGLYPSGAGFTCAFLQSKLVILCPCTRLYSSLAPLHSGYTLPCTGIYPAVLHWVIPCLYPALALGYTPLALAASPALSYKVRLPDRDAPSFFLAI